MKCSVLFCFVLFCSSLYSTLPAGDSDLDVSVESGWWREEGNQARLQQAMEAEGLKRVTSVLTLLTDNLLFC